MSMDDDGNVNYEWTGGNNDEEPNVDTKWIYKKTNAGVQYSNKWNDNTLSLNTTDKTIKTITELRKHK
jgi:hypothetical protein